MKNRGQNYHAALFLILMLKKIFSREMSVMGIVSLIIYSYRRELTGLAVA